MPKGEQDRLYEKILYTQGKTLAEIEHIKALAAKDGWHGFRVSYLNLEEKPDFIKTIKQKSRKKNMPKTIIYAGYYALRDLPRGELIQRKQGAKKVFVKGEYDRGSKEFSVYNYEDINEEYFMSGKTKVWAGFSY